MSSVSCVPNAPESAPESTVQRFVAEVNRRWIARHLVESSAAGLACGCGVAVALMLIQLGRAEPVVSLAFIFPVIGMICGVVGGLRTAPTMADAVCRADRFLENDQLIATAMNLTNVEEPANPWVRTIGACAGHRCSIARPAGAVPHRIGRRGASAIALSLTTVMAILIFAGNSSSQRVAARSVTSHSDEAKDWTQWAQPSFATTPSAGVAANGIEARAEQPPDSRSLTEESTPPINAVASTDEPRSAHSRKTGGAGSGMARGDGATAAVDWKMRTRAGGPQPTAVNEPSVTGSSGPLSKSIDINGGSSSHGSVEMSDDAGIAWANSATDSVTKLAAGSASIGATVDIPTKDRELAREYFSVK